jgi:uncharacterized membrane protein YbhN (UPF0104 family)
VTPDREPVPPELEPTVEIEQAGTRLLGDRRRVITVLAAFVLLIVGIYVLLPKVVGLGGALDRLSDPNWAWIVVALAFCVASFLAYAALFRGILGGRDDQNEVYEKVDLSASYKITMAARAATTLFSAAGAGGVALTYWALRKAGMERRKAACRMVAFLVLLYAVYAAALIVFGVLLRTGVLNGDNPAGGTIVPAATGVALFLITGLLALIPGDLERRITTLQGHPRMSRAAKRLAAGPATVASGVRTAFGYLRHPRSGAEAVAGAVGYWLCMVGILWACFHAFGGGVPMGVVIQGFFVGMVANLAPSPAAGVGTLDAGMIGAFLLFGIPSSIVFPAVFSFRIIGFWLPIVPGVIGYFQLRRLVSVWQDGEAGGPYTSVSKVTAEAK